MTTWLITPRDPLIFRDGRPFTAAPGARATTLPFPFPSTLAGAVRTLAGTDTQTGQFDDSRIDDLLQKQIRGPLLAKLDADGNAEHLFVPAPADALILKTEDAGTHPQAARQLWLRPVELPNGIATNLPQLPAIVAPHKAYKEKVHRQKPAFWNWEDFEAWLRAPQEEEIIPDIRLRGLPALPQDYRVHVRIAPETQTAEEGGLFVTSGLEFTRLPTEKGNASLGDAQAFGLLLETDAELQWNWGFLGGERRVASWRKANFHFPACPDAIRERIVKDKACRLVLLTPAFFDQGCLPSWGLQQAGAQANIVTAAVPRYQTVSGWDYQKGKPKPNRRLAPAGSVYYLKLEGNEDAIRAFVNATWMQNISDDAQARRDGFGLAVLGTWNGQLANMEVSHA